MVAQDAPATAFFQMCSKLPRELSVKFRGSSDAVFLFGIVFMGALLRVLWLDSVPFGLHGDEAWTGIDARRILKEGWIGLYVASALGQPAGPLYVVAAVFELIGDSVWTLRFTMALIGSGAMVLLYLLGKEIVEPKTSLIAAAILSVDLWHLHYSRIGFMLIFWPAWHLLSLLFLVRAVKRGSVPYGFSFGLCWGCGFLTYNAWPTSAAALLGAAVIFFLAPRSWGMKCSPRLLLSISAGLVAGLMPIMATAYHSPDLVLGRFRGIGVSSDGGDLQSLATKIVTGIITLVSAVVVTPHPDGSDGMGVITPIAWYQAVAILGGAFLLIRKGERITQVIIFLSIVILPLGSAITVTSHGLFRRCFAIIPFLSLVTAVSLSHLWSYNRSAGIGLVARLAVVSIFSAMSYRTLHFYFVEYPNRETTRFVFCQELAAFSRYYSGLSDAPYVLFASGRWGIEYEALRFQLPDLSGHDVSSEFSGRVESGSSPTNRTLAVFLDKYLDPLQRPEWASEWVDVYRGENARGELEFIVAASSKGN